MTKIVDKIRKLQALAAGSEGHEAASAAALARRLMAEHALSTADLTLSALLADDPLGDDALPITRASWTAQLAWALGRHTQVEVVRTTGRGLGVRAQAWGHQSDLAVWRYLYEVAHREIQRSAAEWRRRYLAAYGVSPSRSAGTRFREGAVAGLDAKLQRQRRADAGDTDAAACTALALAGRAARALAAQEAACPTAGVYRGGVGGSPEGYRAGGQISLNAGVEARAAAARRRLTD